MSKIAKAVHLQKINEASYPETAEEYGMATYRCVRISYRVMGPWLVSHHEDAGAVGKERKKLMC